MRQIINRLEKRLGKKNVQILIAILVMALVCGAMLLEQKILNRFDNKAKIQQTEKFECTPETEDERGGL